jgi:hypothetical protein
MQILTDADIDFPKLLEAIKTARVFGRYKRGTSVRIVCAAEGMMLVYQEHDPNKIAFKPARSVGEVESHCRRLLNIEQSRGAEVQLIE